MENYYYEKLIEYLNEQCNVFFSKDESSSHTEYVATFFGTVGIDDGSSVKLIIGFDRHFPLRIPDFLLEDNNVFRVHVGIDGKICLYDESAILINKDMPEQLLIDCYNQALNILNILPGTEKYALEISREFDAYWIKATKRRAVYACFEPSEVTYEEYNMLFGEKIVVAKTENEAAIMAYNNLNVKKKESDFYKKCLVLRLRKKSDLIKIRENYKWGEVRNYILNNLTSSNKKRFERELEIKVKKTVRYILLVYEAPMGDIVFGFRVEFSGRRYVQLSNISTAKIEPVYVKRVDYNYLMARIEGHNAINGKSVLLLGAGSIGGFLANNLCQMGITQIDILDKDNFYEENACRHFLGFSASVGSGVKNKADLMKVQLEKMYPYVDIDSLNYTERSAEDFLLNEQKLKNYELIISALGEPTLNLEINRILYRRNIKTPFLCCFNEPYGVGGHIIISNIDKNSCLQCLYTKVNASELTSFRGSLVEEGQSFKKYVSGCSGAFVPYSSLDSQQTALLATRFAVKILSGEITENILVSWVGDSDLLIRNNYRVSRYYELLMNNREYEQNNFGNCHCLVCGGGI